ncbi:hypothetical protein WA1_32845 [Scytonema hofmannii PCC 7110]|jgi:hypothetical protein|uniref:Uncharacterized protein n=1 Tax=Scytonema hofmannii PCC 7110 TaxID=128403 RepID=A0A139X4F2_9CYAN|nr:hypothetical protein [Scytonema hofmannii]KYC39502.1 hypothetical protein WA1_32845 [Scytonema hofmannii PCC 7110]
MSDQFTFTVTNQTGQAITELWASVDDEEWSQFTLSDEGIPSGETVTIAWAEYTNDSPCEWYISTVFEDESETEPVLFNFCEEPDLVIE